MFTMDARATGGGRPGARRPVRSVGATLGLCAAVALTAAGCGGSGGASATPQPSSTTSSATATPSGTAGAADASGLSADDKHAITTAFEKFFDGESDADTKLSHVQDPDRFADTIHAQAGLDIAKSTTVKVSKMDKVAPGRASVTYTILMDGKPVLPDQNGFAVREDGAWKVSASSFCTLLTLENGGTPPQECSGVAGSGGQSSGGQGSGGQGSGGQGQGGDSGSTD